ncbi:hypothetical protein ACVWZX_003756 [Deinococcus sp. UYEF24]
MFQQVLISIGSSPQAQLALRSARTLFSGFRRPLLTVLDDCDLPLSVIGLPPRSTKESIDQALIALQAAPLSLGPRLAVIGQTIIRGSVVLVTQDACVPEPDVSRPSRESAHR